MSRENTDNIRAATYLAAQERQDLRGFKATRTGKTSGKIQCNPPNKQCGNRCIPPNWDCRLKGEGTNSELNAHKGDLLAGIASIQRGAKDLRQGAIKLDPARVQRGRSSVIRGVVKIAPGSKLEDKKQLKKRLNEYSTPFMAVIGVSMVGLAVHAGLKRNFTSYRNGAGAEIDAAAARAIDRVLDVTPGFAGRRIETRATGAAAAASIGRAVAQGGRLEAAQLRARGNLQRMGPLSFRPNAADTEASFLIDNLNTVNRVTRSNRSSYESWRQESLTTLYGATSPGTRPRGQRGSIFSEHAANEYLVSKFGLDGTGVVGPNARFSMAGSNRAVEEQLSQRISAWGESMRQDMQLRRITGPDGTIRNQDVNAYIRTFSDEQLGLQFAHMNARDRARARTEAHRLIRVAISDTSIRNEAHRMRTRLVSEYDNYFAGVARSMERNAAAADSPVGDGVVGLARFTARRRGETVQFTSRDHADLWLQNHYHVHVLQQRSSFTVSDNKARRVAQSISRAAELPSTEEAYRILNQSGFPQLERARGSATPTAPATPPTPGVQPRRANRQQRLMTEAELMQTYLNAGFSPEAARNRARQIIEERNNRQRDRRRGDAGEERLGKPCGASHIPKAHNCTKGQSALAKTEAPSENGKRWSGKKIATTALVAGVGVLAVAALSDAYQLSTGLGLKGTPDFRTTMRDFKKQGGFTDNQTAYGAYYDKVAADQGWKPGTLVYTKPEKGENAHFAVYMGRTSGIHSFAQFGGDVVLDRGGFDVVNFGPSVSKETSRGILFVKAPDSYQVKNPLEVNDIRKRLNQLTGKPLKYDLLTDNCETWARMIAGGGARSKQVEKVTFLSKGLLRGLELYVRVTDPNAAYAGNGRSARSIARELDTLEGKKDVRPFSALLRRSKRSDRTDDLDSELITPEELLPEGLSAIEAASRIKRYLMLLVAMVADAKGNGLSPERADAKGKRCGQSYIPRQHKCQEGATSTNKGTLKAAAKVALVAGAVAGGVAITRRLKTKEEWDNHPQNPRNNPKLSDAEADRLIKEAVEGGQKWDVQEQINAHRQSMCSGGPGKVQAPAKFDSWQQSRCFVGGGAYGHYYVHTSGKYGIKTFLEDSDPAYVEKEFDIQGYAKYLGVNTPEVLKLRKDAIVMEHLEGYEPLQARFGRGLTAGNATRLERINLIRTFRPLHEGGIAHRDIHPANVLYNPAKRQFALVDYGLAMRNTGEATRFNYDNASFAAALRMDLKDVADLIDAPRPFRQRWERPLLALHDDVARNPYDFDRAEFVIRRYYDDMERAIKATSPAIKPRSRFIQGVDQPRIPGLDNELLEAPFRKMDPEGARMIKSMLRQPEQGTLRREMAKAVGVRTSVVRRFAGAPSPKPPARPGTATFKRQVSAALGSFF